jgi:hypothetical protein
MKWQRAGGNIKWSIMLESDHGKWTPHHYISNWTLQNENSKTVNISLFPYNSHPKATNRQPTVYVICFCAWKTGQQRQQNASRINTTRKFPLCIHYVEPPPNKSHTCIHNPKDVAKSKVIQVILAENFKVIQCESLTDTIFKFLCKRRCDIVPTSPRLNVRNNHSSFPQRCRRDQDSCCV